MFCLTADSHCQFVTVEGCSCAGSKLSSIEMYSSTQNSWAHYTQIPSGGKVGVGAAVAGDALFLVGGFTGTDISSDVERFDILTKRCRTQCELNLNNHTILSCNT